VSRTQSSGRSSFRARDAQDALDAGIVAFLSERGFQHFRMEDENVGGRLVPLTASDRTCNVYSLAPDIDRQTRYA
jgi:hypothetical protein